jgi:hypothetical protein
MLNYKGGDGIIAALEHRDRMAGIRLLGLSGPQLEKCVSLIQRPFPVLRYLSFGCVTNNAPVLTDACLAASGSASRLQLLQLSGVPFPTLPKFLLSASELVHLDLKDITSAGYISPEAMATCLATLKRLRSLVIKFQSERSFPDLTSPLSPLPTRGVLPALSSFTIKGVSKYLEDLVARIDTPQLESFNPHHFCQPTDVILDISQLAQFIHRAQKLKLPSSAHVDFRGKAVAISLTSRKGGHSALWFYCTWFERQLTLLAHCFPLFSQIDTLQLASSSLKAHDAMPWLDFLRPFNAVETLRVDDEEVQYAVAGALGGDYELTSRPPAETDDILPKLQAIVGHFESEVIDIMEPFLRKRSESGHPVEVQEAM